jgi:hypothetical protein
MQAFEWAKENWTFLSLVVPLAFLVFERVAKWTKTKKDDAVAEDLRGLFEELGLKIDLNPSYIVEKVVDELDKRSAGDHKQASSSPEPTAEEKAFYGEETSPSTPIPPIETSSESE